MPETWAQRHHRGTVRPVLAPEYRPNPRSERYSNPFSDSFNANFLELCKGEVYAGVKAPNGLARLAKAAGKGMPISSDIMRQNSGC